MATKRLSRTVLEGGSLGSYNWECVHYTRVERQKSRIELRRVAKGDIEPDEYVGIERKNPWSGEKFTDHLSPLYGYLRKNAGRAWNDVYSDLAAQFDVRSLAGYHVFVQHIQREVCDWYDVIDDVPGSVKNGTYRDMHYVDADGILRFQQGKTWKNRRKKQQESS